MRPCVFFVTFQTAQRSGLLTKKKSGEEWVTEVKVNQAPPVIKCIRKMK